MELWRHSCRIVGGSNLSNVRRFVILVSFRDVFVFDNATKKKKVKSRSPSRSRPRTWVTAGPFRRQLLVTSAIHFQGCNQDFSEVRTILQIALPLPHPRPENNDNNNNNLP